MAVFEPSTPRIIELREVTSADRCASSPFFFFGLSSATGVRGLAIFRCPDSKPPTKHNIGAPRRCFFFVLLASAVVSRPVNLAADPTIPSSPSTFLARSSFSPLATSRGKNTKNFSLFPIVVISATNELSYAFFGGREYINPQTSSAIQKASRNCNRFLLRQRGFCGDSKKGAEAVRPGRGRRETQREREKKAAPRQRTSRERK